MLPLLATLIAHVRSMRLIKSCALCSLNFDSVFALLLHLSHLVQRSGCLMLLCFRSIHHCVNLVLGLCCFLLFHVKLDLNFSLVLQGTLRTFLLLFCSNRSTQCCWLLGRCTLLRKILFDLGSRRCLLLLAFSSSAKVAMMTWWSRATCVTHEILLSTFMDF